MFTPAIPGHVIDAIARAKTIEELQEIAAQHLDDLGFSMFAFHMSRHSKYNEKILTIFTSYPEEWLQRYVKLRYLWDDSVHAQSLKTIVPFEWSSVLDRGITPASGRIFGEASEFSIRDGFSVPIRGLNNTFSVFSAVADGSAGERKQALLQNGGILTLLGSMLHQRATEILEAEGKLTTSRARLTAREIEVLKWIGAGKTSPDIAQILMLSESTVDAHVESAMRKLEATTRSHAAVIAALEGLIEPD